MTASSPQVQAAPTVRRWPWVALFIVLAIGFAVHALMSSWDKSPTYDEPVHALSSWLIVNEGDFRVNPEHPSLWKYVAGLPLLGQPLTVDLRSPLAREVLTVSDREWQWMVETLYGPLSAPTDAVHLITRARIAMSVFGVALVLVVARWAWVWGGPVAALLAVLLLSLDPNFLAHGGLVTNDVAATMLITLAVFLTWRVGERMTFRKALALSLVCAAGVGTKFSCLLLGPMVGVPLLYHAFDRGSPWLVGVGARQLAGSGKRLGVVLAFGLATALVCWLMLWPLYQFRAAPTRDGTRFDDRYSRLQLGTNQILLRQQNDPQFKPLPPDQLARAAMREHFGPMSEFFFQLTERNLVPQAWGFGLSHANTNSMMRGSYLMREYSSVGFPLYFPLAMLFKTPTATLAILFICAMAGLSLARRRIQDGAARWKLICLIVPPVIYLGVACTSHLNIGVRHVLPLFPPMYVAAGVLMARGLRLWSPAKVWVPLAMTGLAVETLVAFPNYLPFFNLPSGGTRGGIDLLGDSNLDWGQDLPALSRWYADWRKTHPTEPFYLSYFGSAPPASYGIDYVNAVPGYDFDFKPPTADLTGGVYAVSATHLQAIYWPQYRDPMSKFLQSKPLATINGTIFIYPLAPAPPQATTRPATTNAAR